MVTSSTPVVLNVCKVGRYLGLYIGYTLVSNKTRTYLPTEDFILFGVQSATLGETTSWLAHTAHSQPPLPP